ncbi:MAG: hypothetical protein RR350_01715 [Oscillibacter sp.]
MENTLQEKLDQMLNAYSRFFDIERDTEGFPAVATYHFREENYILSKNNTIYATEQHEHVYFFVTERLDAVTLQAQIDASREAGLARIHPDGEHMFTFITLVVVANSIDPEAQKLIQRYRFRKNFRLALHGWMEYHIAAMDVSANSFLSNPAGKEARKTLERNFLPKAK